MKLILSPWILLSHRLIEWELLYLIMLAFLNINVNDFILLELLLCIIIGLYILEYTFDLLISFRWDSTAKDSLWLVWCH